MAKKKKQPKPNAEYEIPKFPPGKGKRILAFDPGTRNMGVAVVATDGKRIRVLANSVLTNPISTLVTFAQGRELFLSEVARWVDTFKPNGIIAERFQTRGNGGPLIECVGVMLGLLAGSYAKLPVTFITASTWKNAYHARFAGSDLKLTYTSLRVPPHQLDASLIGCFGLERGLQRQLDYTPKLVISQVESSSLLPVKEKRKRK